MSLLSGLGLWFSKLNSVVLSITSRLTSSLNKIRQIATHFYD